MKVVLQLIGSLVFEQVLDNGVRVEWPRPIENLIAAVRRGGPYADRLVVETGSVLVRWFRADH